MNSGHRKGRSRNRLGAQPTIDDVARLAAVSKGTVSHVISGRAPVSPETRARVERAIAALGYRPAESARSLTARKRPATLEQRFDAQVPRLTTVGYVSVDYTAYLDRLPEREERRVARTIEKSIGGPASNVAAIAANIGPPYQVAASIITAIGVDQDSDWAAAELANRKVDVIVPCERREGRLNRALILVEADGRRTIVGEPSSLAEVDVQRFLAKTNPRGLRWCLHLEGFQVPRQIGAIAKARRKGFRTSMQVTGLPPEWLRSNFDRILSSFDVVVLHRESLQLLPDRTSSTRRALAALARQAKEAGTAWPELVLVTRGAEGAAAITRQGDILEAPALTVPVVDTTGAGDTFVGCFLAAWLNACDPAEALRLACLAGSLQVTRFGAQEIRPTTTELLALAPARLPNRSTTATT
jgi:ribokinase